MFRMDKMRWRAIQKDCPLHEVINTKQLFNRNRKKVSELLDNLIKGVEDPEYVN